MARVVHAVLLRRRPRRRRAGARDRASGGRPILARQRSDRMARGSQQAHPRQVLQLRVSRPPGRHDCRRVSEDAPGAVRRVCPVEGPAVRSPARSSSRWDRSRPGPTPTLLPVDGHSISVAICYEMVYPDLVRQFVARGSELLTTITNDAWFGRTSAPYQHFAQASMRAIEKGGISSAPRTPGSAASSIRTAACSQRADIFEPAVMVGEARFLRTSTFYTRHGDVFAYASAVMTSSCWWRSFQTACTIIPSCRPSTI